MVVFSLQLAHRPTPQAEERLAEATLAVASPPAGACNHAPASSVTAPLANGGLHVPINDGPAAAEVSPPQEPALKVRRTERSLR